MFTHRDSLSIKDVSGNPWLTLEERYFLGQIVEGKPISYEKFGLFVKERLEHGVEGLLHQSRGFHPRMMSQKRIAVQILI